MELLQPRHLVLVRHGESEGDVRRRERRPAGRPTKDEEQTETGHAQSQSAGRWIAKHILEDYGIKYFDTYLTSPLVRTVQSARSLGLTDNWTKEENLQERDRGSVQGLTKQQHKDTYPDSYKMMSDFPFHWVPPGGESILAVAHRFSDLIDKLTYAGNIIMMTHRDVIWAAHVSLDKLSLDNVAHLNTDNIFNGQVIHYTNINPSSGSVDGAELVWKRSVQPPVGVHPAQSSEWTRMAVG